jgi:flagellar motor switch protein FliN
MALTDTATEFLNQTVQTVIAEVPDVLSMAISKTVSIEPGEPVEADAAAISGGLTAPAIQVQFTVTEQPNDVVYIYFDGAFGLNIAQWMTGEEDAEAIDESHLDALREAANMILGSLATSFTDQLGRSIEFYSIRADVVEDPASISLDMEEPAMVPFTVSVEGEEAQFAWLVTAADTIAHFQDGAAPEEESAEDMDIMSDEMGGDMGTEMDGGMMEDVTESMDSGMDAGMDAGMGGAPMGMPAGMPDEQEIELEIPGVEGDKVEMLLDLSLPLTIELGRTRMLIKDILELGHGSVVEFDKLAGEPVDLLINDKKVAEGEVVVIDEHFGIRLTGLVRPSDRIKNLGG